MELYNYRWNYIIIDGIMFSYDLFLLSIMFFEIQASCCYLQLIVDLCMDYLLAVIHPILEGPCSFFFNWENLNFCVFLNWIKFEILSSRKDIKMNTKQNNRNKTLEGRERCIALRRMFEKSSASLFGTPCSAEFDLTCSTWFAVTSVCTLFVFVFVFF